MADINLGVGGANSAVAEGYTIDNSFVQEYNSTRTVEVIYGGFGGNPPTTTKGTISFWFKWGALNGGAATWKLLNVYNSQVSIMPEGGTYDSSIYVAVYNEAVLKLVSTAKFRDTSAWYHICAVFDTTLSTASDRVKIYINGVRITDWSTANYPSQNADLLLVKENTKHFAGHNVNAGKPYGYYADMYYIHNQAKDVTDFGEFDADTGIWKPIEYTGTFGSYGYHWDFSNASNLAEDQSGNDASTGQMTCSAFNVTSSMQSTDTPTNNFATNNPLAQNDMNSLHGATQWTHNNASDWESSISTIGVTRGKWYFEASMDSTGNMIGIIANNGITDSLNCMDSYPGDRLNTQNAGIGYHGAGNVFQNDTFTSGMPTYGGGNIISCALDMDNGYVYFARNGSWINSGDPTSGSSGTGGWAVYDTSDIQFFATAIYSTSDNIKCNWGGCTIYSISSAETDANGYGTFEYAPPSGYYALCSKNLAEFG